MKLLKGFILLVLIVIVVIAAVVVVLINPFGASPLNSYEKDGSLVLAGLREPVTVHRDEKGMAYIYARNDDDLFMAQGFVTAQDRLFQMELTRLFASGRIAELAGEGAKDLDTRMRTLGFHRNAKIHAGLLSEKTKMFFQKYVDGVNAFIEHRPKERHLEFKLAGIKPTPWTIVDSLTLIYYMGWSSAANLQTEIIAQMLIDKLGTEKAMEIFPLNINPDDGTMATAGRSNRLAAAVRQGMQLNIGPRLLSLLESGPLQVGSNNWVAGPSLSPSAKPIVANDPHLDTTILPGPWYPCGLIGPDIRAVGVNIPGIPGMVVGRTEHIAIGVTNAYGDGQDLYVETIDPKNPGHYLEGDKSIPFMVIEETLKYKDKDAEGGFGQEKIKIRMTKRGPVVSNVLPGLTTDRVITLRWSSFEAMGPDLGFERLLESRSVSDVRDGLKHINQISLNFVFADSQGNIGWQTTGRLPVRSQRDGSVPYVVTDGRDNWTGWIPWEQMPHAVNPERGWLGTCNHLTVGQNYPYYYSSHMSPSYRYRRLIELMGSPGQKTVADHWGFQRDAMNLMAREIAPIIAQSLTAHEDTQEMGRLLAEWDFKDHPDSAAAVIFQSVYREFAFLVYADELGAERAKAMLTDWYFWQERLMQMVLAGEADWFDNIATNNQIENRGDLFHQAALNVRKEFGPLLGNNPADWQWGKVHRFAPVSPIRRSGPGKEWLGGGSHPMAGSGETLYRGIYKYNEPFNVTTSASLRMVADLGDPDKILAVLPGGVAGRQFDPHTTDQVQPYMNGEEVYWWFSDAAIKNHAETTQTLKPE